MQSGSAIYHLEPLGRTIDAKPGQTLMQAAAESGLRWPTICGGMARCGVCYVRIEVVTGALPPPTDAERRGLRLVPAAAAGPDVRLACQLVATGQVSVRKTGVVPKSS